MISACLLGLNSKYNAGSNKLPYIGEIAKKALLIPVCPEQLGGLPTPRPSCEICGGDGRDVLTGRARVCAKSGEDCSAAFIRGGRETLLLAKTLGAEAALLKARSPSCGFGEIYDGTFLGKIKAGAGVTAAILTDNGLPVFTEEDKEKFLIWLKNRGS